MSSDLHDSAINRREAIRRVSVMLGGVAFGLSRPSIASGAFGLPGVGGMLAAIENAADGAAAGLTGSFTAEEIAFLDEIAETILPQTNSPGAKAARVGGWAPSATAATVATSPTTVPPSEPSET